MGEARRRLVHHQSMSPQARKHEALVEVGRHLDRVFNGQGKREIGYVLLVFPLGTGLTSDLTSNAAPGQGLAVLREQVRLQEQKLAQAVPTLIEPLSPPLDP